MFVSVGWSVFGGWGGERERDRKRERERERERERVIYNLSLLTSGTSSE